MSGRWWHVWTLDWKVGVQISVLNPHGLYHIVSGRFSHFMSGGWWHIWTLDCKGWGFKSLSWIHVGYIISCQVGDGIFGLWIVRLGVQISVLIGVFSHFMSGTYGIFGLRIVRLGSWFSVLNPDGLSQVIMSGESLYLNFRLLRLWVHISVLNPGGLSFFMSGGWWHIWTLDCKFGGSSLSEIQMGYVMMSGGWRHWYIWTVNCEVLS